MELRPSQLSAATGISVPYASQILAGKRNPSERVALLAFDNLGCRIGPLKGLSQKEIDLLRKMGRSK